MSKEVGKKFDGGKVRFDLLPPKALEGVASVMTFGAEKYGANNWRKLKGWRWRYFAAAMRHLWAWKRGQKLDPESGLHHLSHAATNVIFLLSLDLDRSS